MATLIPSDFLFQLSAGEKTEVVAHCDPLQNLKFSKAAPFAFTEHGATQAAHWVFDARGYKDTQGQHVDQRTEGTVSVQAMTLIRPPVMPMATNMRHVVQLLLPLTKFVATLARRLSWSDFVNLLPLNSLDKHERQPGEEVSIGLILCAESSREQVELLRMRKDGITVAEYWTELPPKAELEQKLHSDLLEARERRARRLVLLADLGDA